MLHKIKSKTLTSTTLETVNVNLHNLHHEIYFKIILVKLYNENIIINTYALLDDASSSTLINEEVARQLNLDGPNSQLKIKWTTNQWRLEQRSKLLNIYISGIENNSNIFQIIGARTVKEQHLPVQ